MWTNFLQRRLLLLLAGLAVLSGRISVWDKTCSKTSHFIISGKENGRNGETQTPQTWRKHVPLQSSTLIKVLNKINEKHWCLVYRAKKKTKIMFPQEGLLGFAYTNNFQVNHLKLSQVENEALQTPQVDSALDFPIGWASWKEVRSWTGCSHPLKLTLETAGGLLRSAPH